MKKWMTDALVLGALLLFASGAAAQDYVCGDVNDNGSVTTSDALQVLRKSVGQNVSLICPPAGGVAQTGQETCFSPVTNEVATCTGTGQDGELQLGRSHAFTDNGDGTITDTTTGLVWEKLSDDGSIHDKDTTYTWANAFSGKIATLNSQVFAGHSDWRLPNRFELDTLVNLGAHSPATAPEFSTGCVASCTVLTCSCTRPDHHWSSTTYLSNTIYAWTVYFAAGDAFATKKELSYLVRAVRGGA